MIEQTQTNRLLELFNAIMRGDPVFAVPHDREGKPVGAAVEIDRRNFKCEEQPTCPPTR